MIEHEVWWFSTNICARITNRRLLEKQTPLQIRSEIMKKLKSAFGNIIYNFFTDELHFSSTKLEVFCRFQRNILKKCYRGLGSFSKNSVRVLSINVKLIIRKKLNKLNNCILLDTCRFFQSF